MRKSSGISFYDSCCDVQELSPEEIYSSIQKYWSVIAMLPRLLTDTQKLFSGTQTIWPDQCGWIIDDFHLLTERIQIFSAFLDTSSQFSGSFRLLRYPLAQKLHSLDAQLRDVCILLGTFRSYCQKSTYDITSQCQEISSCLKKLLQHWRQVKREVQSILEQIKMPTQEKRKCTIIRLKDFERTR